MIFFYDNGFTSVLSFSVHKSRWLINLKPILVFFVKKSNFLMVKIFLIINLSLAILFKKT